MFQTSIRSPRNCSNSAQELWTPLAAARSRRDRRTSQGLSGIDATRDTSNFKGSVQAESGDSGDKINTKINKGGCSIYSLPTSEPLSRISQHIQQGHLKQPSQSHCGDIKTGGWAIGKTWSMSINHQKVMGCYDKTWLKKKKKKKKTWDKHLSMSSNLIKDPWSPKITCATRPGFLTMMA